MGEKFLKHLYKSKRFGKVEDWNEDLGIGIWSKLNYWY